MFGLSLGGQLIQGSAQITWNCISQIANILWYKFNNTRQPIMPRSRRKHHSRSRSRSHSHEKNRDVKRRKIEIYDSPNPKRSVSPEDIDHENLSKSITEEEKEKSLNETSIVISDTEISDEKDVSKSEDLEGNESMEVSEEPTTPKTSGNKRISRIDETPNRRLTPKQLQKKLESEKKRQQREKEKAEREKQRLLEKEKKEAEKLLEKEKREAEKLQKKEEKQKELELKQKEKEEKEEQRKREKELKRLEEEKKKEQKRIEKEMKEEQKRKEEEERKLKKQQELEEKEREKLKEQEKKQKAAAAFVSFFVPKKNENETKKMEEKPSLFMPFEVKTDMRLPPSRREPLNENEKDHLIKLLENNLPEYSYLADLKTKKIKTCPKTWPCEDSEDEVTIIEDEDVLGETICEDKPKSEKMKAKFLKFHENQRPAYFGTWRKKSKKITGRTPFGREDIFDYDVDSDDDWEEEEQGENLEVMSDEDKENENDPENEDYEVDNDFFVPHGHLSDDEVDDEVISKLDPESQKHKLKLMKDAFDEDIKSKTHKLKPRAIGCIWYDEDGTNVEEAIDRYLKPLAVITNGQVEVKKRDIDNNVIVMKNKKTPSKEIPENLMVVLIKLVHGNKINKKKLIEEFLKDKQAIDERYEITKADVSRHISNIAQYSFKKRWIVDEEVAKKFGVDLTLANA